jgi:DNA-directed RNA polymerase subunit N
MIVPVRCFTCGNPVADKWEEYARRVKTGEKPGRILDDLGLKRYCCRRMFIGHVEFIDELLRFAEVAARKRTQTQ